MYDVIPIPLISKGGKKGVCVVALQTASCLNSCCPDFHSSGKSVSWEIDAFQLHWNGQWKFNGFPYRRRTRRKRRLGHPRDALRIRREGKKEKKNEPAIEPAKKWISTQVGGDWFWESAANLRDWTLDLHHCSHQSISTNKFPLSMTFLGNQRVPQFHFCQCEEHVAGVELAPTKEEKRGGK